MDAMASMLITSEWFSLGSSDYFRLYEMFQMKWQINVSDFLVIPACFAGPIAVAKPEGPSGSASNFNVAIYTAAGQLITKIPSKVCSIVLFAWSLDEQLLCVQNDGKVIVYTMFGQLLEEKSFTMGSEAQQMKIVQAKTFTSYLGKTGLAVLTGANRFYVANNVDEPKVWRLQDPPGKEVPCCWTLHNTSRDTKLVAIIGCDTFLLSQGQRPEQVTTSFKTPVRQYAAVSLSPDASMLAFVSINGFVQVCSVDFKNCIAESDSGLHGSPEHFFWCGNKAVACCSNDQLTLVNLQGETLLFSFDEQKIFCCESDGLRIIGGQQHQFLSAVPECVQSMFTAGSMSPGAILLEAYKELQRKSYKAYEYIKMIDKDLDESVAQCIKAACQEYDPNRQKNLLQAAAYGKSFTTSTQNAELLLSVQRELRVLNAVRDYGVALPLTYDQLKLQSYSLLLERLLSRRQWPIAFKVCQQLRLPQEEGINHVLRHWASYKTFVYQGKEPIGFFSSIDRIFLPPGATAAILEDGLQDWKKTTLWNMLCLGNDLAFFRQTVINTAVKQIAQRHLPDEEVASAISQKFLKSAGISFDAIAKQAAALDRKTLATLLLDKEPVITKQIVLLMQLGKIDKALHRAIETGDSELVLFVILRLKDSLEKKGDLDFILQKFPMAYGLYKQYCHRELPQHLKACFEQTDDFFNLGLCWLKDAAQSSMFDVREKVDALRSAEKCLQQQQQQLAKDDLACKLIEEQIKLLKYQEEFEEKFHQAFIDCSLKDTIIQLLKLGEQSKADVLRKEFRLSDRQFHCWKLEALASEGRLLELEAFAKSRKPPFGFLPFIDVCLRYGHENEAKKYLAKLTTTEDKVRAMIKLQMLKEAADLAFEQKDAAALNRVATYCGPQTRGLLERINGFKAQLQANYK